MNFTTVILLNQSHYQFASVYIRKHHRHRRPSHIEPRTLPPSRTARPTDKQPSDIPTDLPQTSGYVSAEMTHAQKARRATRFRPKTTIIGSHVASRLVCNRTRHARRNNRLDAKQKADVPNVFLTSETTAGGTSAHRRVTSAPSKRGRSHRSHRSSPTTTTLLRHTRYPVRKRCDANPRWVSSSVAAGCCYGPRKLRWPPFLFTFHCCILARSVPASRRFSGIKVGSRDARARNSNFV